MVDRHSDREMITGASRFQGLLWCSRHSRTHMYKFVRMLHARARTHTSTHTLDWNTAPFQEIRARQPLQKHVKCVTVKESGGLMRKQTE